MDIYLFAVIILICLAVSDLIVGVSNDAVNFLNSSIGSKVAPRYIIMIIASLGMLAGVTFSSGMMEVARKSIFHPKYFLMPEIMVIFLAVMITDILLLDLFNTFALPTSTTVSIVFELLGAAVAVSLVKISQSADGFSTLTKYINSSKALAIILGILLSVVLAFVLGAIIQFFTRLIFTFDYKKRLKRYGAIWGGLALSTIIYFILIKGAKGASFITPEMLGWINTNTWLILIAGFLISAIILQILILLFNLNILKPIVLIGTFALSMAFAANDLVNFIGVPLAGLSSYSMAKASGDPLNMSMEALQEPIQSNTFLLLIAGLIMVITLWFSRKARSVTETEVNLGRQDEGMERFESSIIARTIVRNTSSIFDSIRKIIPDKFRDKISSRLDLKNYKPEMLKDGNPPSFDLLRASVNLMVASAIVSFATSLKLPLSTTYVTFMAAMGSSLSDQAWGRESAVYRITGVIAVIGGWFLTALSAFTVSLIFAFIIYYLGAIGVIAILGLSIYLIWRNHHLHRRRVKENETTNIFNLKKITDSDYAIKISFEHFSILLQEINSALNSCFEALFSQERRKLKALKKETSKFQKWANIIIANVFKTLRLLQREDVETSQKYTQTIGALQKIAESYRDTIMRSYVHIDNNHKGLLDVQIDELRQVQACTSEILDKTAKALLKKKVIDYNIIAVKIKNLKRVVNKFDKNQIKRIQDDSSKTRLSILFYSLMDNSVQISEKTHNLLKIFHESFK